RLVVADEVELGHPGLLEEHLVRAGDPHLTPTELEQLLLAGHARTVLAAQASGAMRDGGRRADPHASLGEVVADAQLAAARAGGGAVGDHPGSGRLDAHADRGAPPGCDRPEPAGQERPLVAGALARAGADDLAVAGWGVGDRHVIGRRRARVA